VTSMVQKTVSLDEIEQELTGEVAEAPWCGSHWADLATPSPGQADLDAADGHAEPDPLRTDVGRSTGAAAAIGGHGQVSL
jgi:hypothetical protein